MTQAPGILKCVTDDGRQEPVLNPAQEDGARKRSSVVRRPRALLVLGTEVQLARTCGKKSDCGRRATR